MSDSLRRRALLLCLRGEINAEKSDTEILTLLLEAVVEVVRRADTDDDLLDCWSATTEYLNRFVREDCRRLGYPG